MIGPDDTGRRFDPIAIGQIVARNLVPVVGILALDWSASTVLLLYFVDTMLSIGGRHDPCIIPRAIPVIENAAALVILDLLLTDRRNSHVG